ncbi:Unconventional myosin-IXb [Chionoecetes opilio]|uniref:Unconventional myosin-IXb n=1 Tax=Chionoecetes opilio TaxID=41210 RepID=A0A8J4YF89_CHIOP|nr:Unconventional myosin-IXb [Chionoecetes opilio]
MKLVQSEYQMGNTKIFMRESQKQKLDTQLHQTILSRIIVIQRWYRTIHQRRHFLNLRAIVIKIQCQVRSWLAQQKLTKLRLRHNAATFIQKFWRGHRVRKWYQDLRQALIVFQACVRGNLSRERFQVMQEEWKQRKSTAAVKSLKEETSVAFTPTITTDTPEPSEPALPPPRRKTNIQNAQGHKLQRRQSEHTVSERRSSDSLQPLGQNLERRLSEASILQQRSSQESDKGGEEMHPASSSSSISTEGEKLTHKPKSFRHRPYSKIPLASQAEGTSGRQPSCITVGDASERDCFFSSALMSHRFMELSPMGILAETPN